MAERWQDLGLSSMGMGEAPSSGCSSLAAVSCSCSSCPAAPSFQRCDSKTLQQTVFNVSISWSAVQIFNLGALIYLFSPFIPVGKLLFKVDSDGIIKVKWLERNRQLSAAGSKDLNKNHKENCFYFLYCCLPHSMQNVILKNYVGDLPYYFYKSHFKTCFKSIISCHLLVSCAGIRKKELSKQFFPLCWIPKQKLRFPTLI